MAPTAPKCTSCAPRGCPRKDPCSATAISAASRARSDWQGRPSRTWTACRRRSRSFQPAAAPRSGTSTSPTRSCRRPYAGPIPSLAASKLEGGDLVGHGILLGERALRLAVPVARIGQVSFEDMHDAVRPARERGFLVFLHDLVGGLPVALLQKRYSRSKYSRCSHSLTSRLKRSISASLMWQ